MQIRYQELKWLLAAIGCGLLASLGTATIANESGIRLPEISHYGYPLAWIVVDLNGPTQYVLINLVFDIVFWVIISFGVLASLRRIVFPNLGIDVNQSTLLLLIFLLIPIGLIMDFVHESGHALWATTAGGRLVYMKIAYLEIYPRLAITPEFQLGLTSIEGIAYGSAAYGLMLLGGSMTTNIASWTLALILFRGDLPRNVQVMLKFLGLFGFLDLPFYIIFPQLGLYHWIFLGGGCGPEPLIGARMVGIPDPIFYLVVVISTLGQVFLYSKTLRGRVTNAIHNLKKQRTLLDIPLQKKRELRETVEASPFDPSADPILHTKIRWYSACS